MEYIYYFGESENKIFFKPTEEGYEVELHYNSLGDYNTLVGVTIPIESLQEFTKIISKSKNAIMSFEDKDANIEFQVGYEITKEIVVFFEIIDYNYDGTNPKNPYRIKIPKTIDNFEVLDELVRFLGETLKKESENYEPEPNTPLYEGKIGL